MMNGNNRETVNIVQVVADVVPRVSGRVVLYLESAAEWLFDNIFVR